MIFVYCLQITYLLSNEMQSETANFAPVPPLGELDETCASSDSGPFAALCANVVIQKTQST